MSSILIKIMFPLKNQNKTNEFPRIRITGSKQLVKIILMTSYIKDSLVSEGLDNNSCS